ncbi:MAG: hypothetical protein C4525_04790 [Desulfarculus sp.]|nr:MAG: hypothetical protein C4525_04790 [Desulfarculus sp.]
MPEPGNKRDRRGFQWPWLLLIALVLLALAQAYTWPLSRFLSQAIPYSFHAAPTYQTQPGAPPPTLVPGDHLQFYYWCWLFTDNLTGPSRMFTNPYEFNTFLSPGLRGVYALFPFSALYALLRPLGPLTAYNLLVLLSFVLAGLLAYVWARDLLQDRWAALLAALCFALLPARTSEVAGGHLYGFVAFMLPLCLWCLGRAWRASLAGRRAAWLAWGAGAGGALLVAALLDPHLIYYLALLLVIYTPLKVLLHRPADRPAAEETKDGGRPWLPVLAAGLGLGIFAYLRQWPAPGLGFSVGQLFTCLALYLILIWTLWLLLAALVRALSRLGLAQARAVAAAGLAPLALAPLYALRLVWDLPHLGAGLLLLLGAWGLWRLSRRLRPIWQGPGREAAPLLRPLLLPALGLALAAAYILGSLGPILAPSQAGGGRSLAEAGFFAPRLADLFDSRMERLAFLGWVLAGLALAGLAWLGLARASRLRGAGLASLWAGLGVGFSLLSLGPNLPAFPLYGLLYRHLPFFNYPRVPGRMLLLGALFLGLLAAWLLREIRRRWAARPAAGVSLVLALAALLVWGYWPPGPPGLSLASIPAGLTTAIKKNLPTGPAADRRLLELPIWPGHAHQSSLYELTITATRALSVNGYSPLAHRRYEQEIYRPLQGLNLGQVTPQALQTLRRLRVGLVTFHDDDQAFPYWLSAFPPALSRERLQASGLLRPLFLEGTVFLFAPQLSAQPAQVGGLTSPVTSLWEAPWLQRDTGRLVEDEEASGWGLLFAEQATPGGPLGTRLPRPAGNVALAQAGRDRPGLLSSRPVAFFQPYRYYPPGRYLARFRLKRGPGEPPGRIEVRRAGGGPMLAGRELAPEALPADGRWHDVELAFSLEQAAHLDLHTRFYGKSDLALDLVLIGFAEGAQPPPFYPASRLWRQTGALVPDPSVPGGLAVLARPQRDPELYLMHGPQQTYGPGRYRARFRLAAPQPAPPQALLAELVAATDLGRLPLGHALVRGRDLGPGYRDVLVEFRLTRRCELGLRVLYRRGGPLKLAGAAVERLD